MRLRDDDESGGDARETVPGLHAQRVQELERVNIDGSGHATFVTEKNWRDAVTTIGKPHEFLDPTALNGGVVLATCPYFAGDSTRKKYGELRKNNCLLINVGKTT